jgi:translation initiation factor 2D
VYTLWHNPKIVPLLYTPLVVVEKMQGGADLMTPGLQRGPPFPAKATKGAVVAIASLEAPTVPMAVGTCEIDVSSLEKVQGMKGQAVSTFHWAGDELWSWSTSNKPGRDPPNTLQGWDEDDEETSLAERTAAVDLDDQDGGVELGADPAERSKAEQAQGVEGEDAPPNKDFIDVIEDKELSTKGEPNLQGSFRTNIDGCKKLTRRSRTPSCTAYDITWSRTRISLTSASTSLFRNRTS